MDIKSVTVACGHTATGTIGSGAADLLDESNCTREVSPLVARYFKQEGVQAQYLRVDKGNDYNCEDCYVRASQANCIGSDLYVEIHLNSGKNRTGDGVEVCVSSTNSETQALAAQVSASIASAIGIDDRGVRFENLIVLKRTKMRAILVEVMFVDTNDIFNYKPDIIAKAVVAGVLGKSVSTKPVLGWNRSADGLKWWYCTDVENEYYYSNSWQLINGAWYLFDGQGYCKTGWVEYTPKGTDTKHWYYLDKESCSMKTGWFQDTDKEWYFFNTDGEMQTGWIVDKGKDYMLYSTGEMVCDIDYSGYHFDKSGVATKL